MQWALIVLGFDLLKSNICNPHLEAQIVTLARAHKRILGKVSLKVRSYALPFSTFQQSREHWVSLHVDLPACLYAKKPQCLCQAPPVELSSP